MLSIATSLFCLLIAAPDPAALPDSAALKALSTQEPQTKEVTSEKERHGIAGIRGAKATFIVAADRDVVLATLWDVDAFPDIFPDIDKMTILKKQPKMIEVKFQIDAVVTHATYTLRRQLDRKKGSIRWREIGEGDVKHIRGSWTVQPTGSPGYARVIYSSYVDVGYFVPTGAVRAMAIRKIGELANRVRAAATKRSKREARERVKKAATQAKTSKSGPSLDTTGDRARK